jgi:hypothetical protein
VLDEELSFSLQFPDGTLTPFIMPEQWDVIVKKILNGDETYLESISKTSRTALHAIEKNLPVMQAKLVSLSTNKFSLNTNQH